MKKISNEEKFKNFQKRKVLRIIIIILSLLTLVLSILSLVKIVNIIWPLILFILSRILLNYRESLIVNEIVEKKEKNKKK